MSEPLLEPGVLVTENCEGCRGTAFKVVGYTAQPPERFPSEAEYARWMAAHERTEPCDECEGGRVVREVPLSEFSQLLLQAQRPPSPSMLREAARR